MAKNKAPAKAKVAVAPAVAVAVVAEPVGPNGPTGPATAALKVARTQPLSITSYIVKVSKAANEGVGVRKNVKELIENLLMEFIRSVNKHAEENLKSRKTLQDRDIEHALNAFLPEGKYRDALIARGNTVIESFTANKKTDGVNMSVPRTREWLVWGLSDKENLHVSKTAVVYLASVLDQFIAELTREANVFSQEKKHSNITMPDLLRAQKKNTDLSAFLNVFETLSRPAGAVKERKPRAPKAAAAVVVAETEGDALAEAPPVVFKAVAKRRTAKV